MWGLQFMSGKTVQPSDFGTALGTRRLAPVGALGGGVTSGWASVSLTV